MTELFATAIFDSNSNLKDYLERFKTQKKTKNNIIAMTVFCTFRAQTCKKHFASVGIRQGLVLLWRAIFRMRHSMIKQIKNLINSLFNPWRRHV